MRFFKKILAIFNAIIILLCSIAQFHHHDETGKMVVFSVSDFKICEYHHCHEFVQNIDECHSHGCHDGNHAKEKDCSLRFSLAKVESKTYSPIVLFCDIFDNELRNISQIVNQFIIPRDEKIVSTNNNSTLLLRAPPVV